MATFTKPFGFFYKHFPSTSYADTPLNNGAYTFTDAFHWTDGVSLGWYDSGSVASSFFGALRVSRSFYGLPEDATLFDTYRAISHTDSTTGSYRALPWGSPACDFLWNIQNSEWLFNESVFGVASDSNGNWSAINTTKSFFERYYPGATGSLGSPTYNITSSWIAYDPKIYPRSDGNQNFRLYRVPTIPAIPQSDYIVVTSQEYPNSPPTFDARVYTSMSYQLGRLSGSAGTGTLVESSSISLQPFYRAGGAAITRAAVSSSLVTSSLYYTSTGGTNLGRFRTALKQRRLFFPTPVSASGTTRSQDYWLKKFTGFNSTQLFTTNGGIYQVDFTLKRDLNNNMYPDTGSYMNVFISDCQTQAPVPADRVPGAAGWYPPATNIVTIGNGTTSAPVMTFYDSTTGYLYEKFSIVLVQYGYPAQLCFEPSGSLANGNYFGCIVDDVEFCKVGITTDPAYIKPEGGGGLDTEYVPAVDR